MRTLLVPIDGSASGNRSVAHAVDNAPRLGDVKLLLLNVPPALDVMGTRGQSEWGPLFLGSTAFSVVQQSPLPVTLIHW